MHVSFCLTVIYFSCMSCFPQQFVSDYFLKKFFWLFGSSRAPFSYLATESLNIPAMGRKAESSYLKSSQVRRNRFFFSFSFFTMSVFAIQSSFSFFMMGPQWPHSLRRGLQRHSSEIMRTDQHWAPRWQTQLNPAPDTCNKSQEVCVISVEQSLVFVNNVIL